MIEIKNVSKTYNGKKKVPKYSKLVKQQFLKLYLKYENYKKICQSISL